MRIKYFFKHVFNSHFLFVALYGIILALALLPYYSDGTIILGGEGNYFLDYSNHLREYGFSWFPKFSLGLASVMPCYTGLNIIILSFIENLTGSEFWPNFFLVFSIYFFPFLAMYLVCAQLRLKSLLSFLVSFFYVINPFTLYYLSCLNQWNTFSIAIMPLFLWVILRYYYDNLKLFLVFGLISACFSFAYTNPPMFVVIHISTFISVIIAMFCHKENISMKKIFKKFSLTMFSFVLFNLWWILSIFIGGMLSTAKSMYSSSFARAWLDTSVGDHGAILSKMFTFNVLIPLDPSYDFFSLLYSNFFMKLLAFTPIVMVVYFVLVSPEKKNKTRFIYFLFLCSLGVLFLVKGNAGPLGFVYNILFDYVPLFNILKTIKNSKGDKYYNYAFKVFILYLLFCSMPLFFGRFIPEYRTALGRVVSRRYKENPEHRRLRKEIINDPVQYRILDMPGGGNYQVLLANNDRLYSGLDPILANTNKPHIIYTHGVKVLYENISFESYGKLLGIFNIKKIFVNEDLVLWFGSPEGRTFEKANKALSLIMTKYNRGSINIYDNTENFLPRIYAVD